MCQARLQVTPDQSSNSLFDEVRWRSYDIISGSHIGEFFISFVSAIRS